jgi:hypothetical protein
LQEDKTSLEEDAEIVADQDHEEAMVKGAVRTDFILSAEIMVIALNEVLDEHLAMRAATLALVAIADHGRGLRRRRADREDGRHRAPHGERGQQARGARSGAASCRFHAEAPRLRWP